MSIKAVTGLQGHGKTYETVKTAVLPAIAQGRRVVTNIRGLDMQAIKAYLETKNQQGGARESGGAPGDFGEILTVTNTVISEPGFLPALNSAQEYDPTIKSIVLPGDLVIVDEAWRFWGTDGRISDADMAFWREHRHFVGGVTKSCCDLIVISQSISDLHRKLRSVVELTTVCTKPKELGITSAYLCDVYTTARMVKGNYLGTHRQKYDKEIFPLYRSYAGAGPGKENVLDKRQNILGKAFWFLGIGICLMVGIGIYSYVVYKNKLESHENSTAKPPVNDPIQKANPSVSSPQTINPISSVVPGAVVGNSNPRAVGHLLIDGNVIVLIETNEGKFRYADNADTYRLTAHGINLELDGVKLVPWAGGGYKK
jgi:zona occludens toxin